jgi:hypothetical protein
VPPPHISYGHRGEGVRDGDFGGGRGGGGAAKTRERERRGAAARRGEGWKINLEVFLLLNISVLNLPEILTEIRHSTTAHACFPSFEVNDKLICRTKGILQRYGIMYGISNLRMVCKEQFFGGDLEYQDSVSTLKILDLTFIGCILQ